MKRINLEVQQGLDYFLELTYTDTITGLPKSLENFTARLSVKPFADMPPTIDLTTENTALVLGGVTGTIKAYFSQGSTAAQDWDQAPYDLVLTDSLGAKTKFAGGLFTIIPTESI